MPELPDLTVYIEHLEERVLGHPLNGIRLGSPFVLRSVEPAIDDVLPRQVTGLKRLAKQIVIELEGEVFVVIHLMISGRLRWNAPGRALQKKNGLAAFDFDDGTMIFTEVSKKKRASLRLVEGRDGLEALNPGGIELSELTAASFKEHLAAAPHTIKRALTDQRVIAGIGNAYSDEILHRARMSPFKQGKNLSDEEAERLFTACREVLAEWTDLLREKTGEKFPDKVTAFHPEMAVHGKYKEPCPVCGAPVQRIVRPENESNYCAGCQTEGRLLADRSLSRLMKDTYPKRLEDLEGM